MIGMITCSACHSELPEGSRFCAQCGVPVGDEGTVEMLAATPSAATRRQLASEGARPSVSVHESHRHPLGTSPLAFLGVLAPTALIATVVLLILGAWVAALIAAAACLGSFAMLSSAVQHDPGSPVARVSRRSTTRTLSALHIAGVYTRAWSRAIASLAAINQRRLRLRRQLQRQFAPLGEAVLEGDQARAAELTRRAAELEQELAASERQAAAVSEQARSLIEREKVGTQATEAFSAEAVESAVAGPDRPATR
jgi:hypothetical protein